MRTHIVAVRMDDMELSMLDRIARAIGKSRSETIRLCILFIDIYMTRGLTLLEILRPLPEVLKYLESRFET
ncbi:MAG: hypothetical protein DRN06_07245 [Thermoprotei archaeon]|nr:MAG: hypothetical protein DRN06_07245 [Thermoprotei archaeon]